MSSRNFKLDFDKDFANDYLEGLQRIVDADSFRISNIKPSEWAEKKRVMSTAVSAMPGPYRFDRTPYLREVVDTLMPNHPAKKIAVMKGAQIGFSTGVIENGIGWIIAENPGPILLMTATKTLSDDSVNTKIDQMIDSCGLRDHIRPNASRKGNNRTGDTVSSKEFSGGRLMTGQTGNHKNIRQISMQYGFIDDFEAAPPSSKQSGDTTTLIEQRFAAYYDKMKVFYISTPEIKQTSNIEPLYLRGNQRKYHVPCPHCGDHIVLEWAVHNDENERVGGIYWELDDNRKLIESSVGYKCPSCGDIINETHKHDMIRAGHWKSTAIPQDPELWSYHISALYAPPGMYDWTYYVKQYLEACPPNEPVRQEKYKTFLNTCLGVTWEERGSRPNVLRLSMNTRPYDVGVVPSLLSKEDGNGPIVMVTCACDLNGTEDDARLDYEIVAWSESGVSYAIDHGSVGTFIPRENTRKIKVDRERWSYHHNVKNSVWPTFEKILNAPLPSDDPAQQNLKIMITGIDTGHYTQQAYQFIDEQSKIGRVIVGLKGKDTDKFRALHFDTPMFRAARERDQLFLVEVNQLKDELSDFMKLPWERSDGVEQPAGFMNYPRPEGNKFTMRDYFSHFESEHRVLDQKDGVVRGAKWIKRNAAVMNHLWDCRVYNLALREILAWMVCREMGIKEANWRRYCELLIGKS
jgi:phage terminase large subunit GpA-like protein